MRNMKSKRYEAENRKNREYKSRFIMAKQLKRLFRESKTRK